MSVADDDNHEMVVELLRLRAAALQAPDGAVRAGVLAMADGIEQNLRLALQKRADRQL